MVDKKPAELGLALPSVPAAAGSFVGYKKVGNLVFVSGQLPMKGDKPMLVGKLGGGVSIEGAYEAAQQCALNILAQLQLALANDWTRFVQVVRLGGFVNCVPEFNDAPKVVNGASDLMVKVFGSSGTHARRPWKLHRFPAHAGGS
jgi:enamine deaminase RidA (YjgF/YER057c/UK114 family)